MKSYWFLYQQPIDMHWYDTVVSENRDTSNFNLEDNVMTMEMDARGESIEEALDEVISELQSLDAQLLYIRLEYDTPKYNYMNFSYPVDSDILFKIIEYVPNKYTVELRNKLKANKSQKTMSEFIK